MASFGETAVRRNWHLNALELAGAVSVWRAVADWNFPASLLLAGLAAIVVAEMHNR